jgi:predicted Zn-dependent peptidase
MKQFHRKWMIGGDNTIVTIVSPTEEMGQKLAKILPNSSKMPVSTMSWKSLPRKAIQKHIPLKGYGSIAIMMGQTIPIKGDHPASIALECAAEIFGGGMTGRLMHIVREQKGLGTYGIYSELKSVNSRTDKIFVISGSFSPDSLDAGMQCTKKMLLDFCQFGITEKELEFAKTRMIGNRKISRDDVTELKNACIDEIIDGNDPFAAFENFDKRVGELTVSKVNDAIKKYLDCTKMIEISCG